MSKQSLLLVDGDTRSLRVLEVSLRKAGFTVTPAASVQDALDKLELHTPDLIISETKFPTDLDGFELRRRVRGSPDWADIPFVFLTAETAIENKIRGLELGVDDYLTKPIYIKEIVTRINILLQKRQRAYFDDRKDGVRFAGRVADMPVVDVIQTIEVSRKSGVIQFVGDRGRQAAIYFRDGKVIDAEAGTLQAEDAVYRLLTWGEGEFEVVFRTVRRREAIGSSSQGLLMEGMRRLDEWSRLLEQLPPLSHRFEIDAAELANRLGQIPDDNNRILRLIDGKRSLLEVIDASDFGDLECIQAIARLYFEGLLLDLDPEQRPRRDTGKPGPLVERTPTPIEEVASGPIQISDLAARSQDRAPPVAAIEMEMISEAEPEAEPAPGPLMGGYRPSSLRLIDEAVAAAQAIEPSLFDSDEPDPFDEPAPLARMKIGQRAVDPRVVTARELVERTKVAALDDDRAAPGGNGESRSAPAAPIDDESSVPTTIDADQPPEPYEMDSGPTDPSRRQFAATFRREDSGLRMIGSHGRDRAEASGELGPQRSTAPAHPDAQRELVTILPRRITREMPVAQPPTPDPEPAKPVELPPPRRITVAGGVVARPGPSSFAKALLVIASLLSGMTVYKYCQKRARGTHDHTSETNLAVPSAPPPDAAAQPITFGIDAATRPNDAAVVAIARPDARVAVPVDSRVAAVDAGVDRVAAARVLMEQAHAAVEDGDPARALELADESLALRKTARTYIERARALQRLDRIDAALQSIDEATNIIKDYPPAFEQRAMILWAARRHDEARPVMEQYLALDPNGKSAPLFKKLLKEP